MKNDVCVCLDCLLRAPVNVANIVADLVVDEEPMTSRRKKSHDEDAIEDKVSAVRSGGDGEDASDDEMPAVRSAAASRKRVAVESDSD